MPASKATLAKVSFIMIEELGKQKAVQLVARLAKETRGNESYNVTIRHLNVLLRKCIAMPTQTPKKAKSNKKCNGYCKDPEACVGGCYEY